VGAVPATRIVTDTVEELYDYDVLRTIDTPTMFVVRVAGPTIVLGGSQSRSVLREGFGDVGIRRRRGGGGAVLLQPDDLWVDWWIPRSDPRWTFDVHQASYLAGGWWEHALAGLGLLPHMHRGRVQDDPAFRVACFSGRGPGEIFINDRKAVGVTQWRVREGYFLSTVLHEQDSTHLADFIAETPDGLRSALSHESRSNLQVDADAILDSLKVQSSPAQLRQLYLIA
jgi:lipoate-protein ligase A